MHRGGGPLGLGFKKLKGTATQQLLITELLSEGTVVEYNFAQVAAGLWDRLILPGMIIKEVNGHEGNWDLMLKALSTPGVVDVQLQRAGPSLQGSESPDPQQVSPRETTQDRGSASALDQPEAQVLVPPLPTPSLPATTS